MDFIDPIRLYFTNSQYNSILEDANRFQICNRNKPNINRFINILIRNYHSDFECTKLNPIKDYISVVDTVYDQTIQIKLKTMFYDISLESSGEKKHKTISFKPQKDISVLLDNIQSNFITPLNLSFPIYIRMLIDSFFQLPIYKREIYLFKENYSKIQNAIDKQKSISFKTNDNSIFEMKPYLIMEHKEKIYNYVIGKVKNNQNDCYEIATRKLMNITEVSVHFNSESDITFSDTDFKAFHKMIKNGVQFKYGDNEEPIIILFNQKAYDLFKIRYLNKPMPVKTTQLENNQYLLEFDCSYFQAKTFFYIFAEDIKIISPKVLATEFKNSYLNAASQYNQK